MLKAIYVEGKGSMKETERSVKQRQKMESKRDHKNKVILKNINEHNLKQLTCSFTYHLKIQVKELLYIKFNMQRGVLPNRIFPSVV